MANRKARNPSTWSVVEAKARLDDVIDESAASGPQRLGRNTDELAMVVPPDDWRNSQWREGTLVEFFQSSGLGDFNLDTSRHPDTIADLKDVDR
ncbi:MAG: prevent-host-death protein [Thermomicrobiales bacterium]